MFFSAHIGLDAESYRWREAVEQHASWLGLTPHTENCALQGRWVLSFGWLRPTAAGDDTRPWRARIGVDGEAAGGVASVARVRSLVGAFEADAGLHPDDRVAIDVSARRGTLRISVPPATPRQIYYARTACGYVIGDDLRLFPRLVADELDEAGVYALLQFGVIPPPFTLYKHVRRIPCGHVFELDGDRREPVCAASFRAPEPEPGRGAGGGSLALIEEALDETLSGVPRASLLYFSGGVDSGLLAARLARMGRTDVELVNYTFGPRDEESRLASDVAAHLGLKCHTVYHDPEGEAAVLERLGRDYSYPFGDFSTLPTNILASESLKWVGRSQTVIEGTGADGAFGLAAKYPSWRRVFTLPRWLRGRAARAYGRLGLWEHNSAVERLARFVRKSVRMPLNHAVIAQNALDGIVYDIPAGVGRELAAAVGSRLEILAAGAGAREQLSILDLVWVCAGRMAAKSFDPLRSRGVRTLYPFLRTRMISLAAAIPWEEKCAGGEAKSLLKTSLSRDLPAAWVYRPKSGFSPPYGEILACARAQDYLRGVVLSRRNPLSHYCRIETLEAMLERARRRRPLSVGAYNFIWSLAFASGWLAQSPRPALQHEGAPTASAVGPRSEDREANVKTCAHRQSLW